MSLSLALDHVRSATSVSTFGELHAIRHSLPLESVEHDILRRCFYPHARALRPLVSLVVRDHFNAEHELARTIARQFRLRDAETEIEEYRGRFTGFGVLRRRLRLRLSTRRLHRLLLETFATSPQEKPVSLDPCPRVKSLPRAQCSVANAPAAHA